MQVGWRDSVCICWEKEFSHCLAVHRLWVNCSSPYKIPLKANTLDRNMSFSLYTVQIHGLLPQNHIFQKSHTWRPWSALKYATSLIMITEQLHIRERKKTKTKQHSIRSTGENQHNTDISKIHTMCKDQGSIPLSSLPRSLIMSVDSIYHL